MSRLGSPTASNKMDAIQLTQNIIEEPKLKLFRGPHEGYMRRLIKRAFELLQNGDTTLEALADLNNK